MLLKLGLFLLLTVAVDSKEPIVGKKGTERDHKLFSLFSIVTFKNDPCASLDSSRNGTCYTSSECSKKGGKMSGNCAAGFGVCCLFEVSSTATRISENCTYLINPGYPSAYSSTGSLTYTIYKCSSEVCSIRLDFVSFTIEGPSATTEASGGPCVDSFVASGTSGLSTPTICGKNTGMHVYMEVGNTDSDTATLAFTFSTTTTSTTRSWVIKATQIPCNSNYKPPPGCLQYHSGLTGRFWTFNFLETTTTSNLASQDYSICIRQEAGYCCVEYFPCSDTNSWTLNHNPATTQIDTNCITDYVGIDGVQSNCDQGTGAALSSRICGGKFGVWRASTIAAQSVCDCSAPFVVEIYTDATNDGTAATSSAISQGACLEYRQVACINN